MTAIKIPTAFNIDLDFELPEFHRRFFAWMIDVAMQVIYFRIAMSVLSRVVPDEGALSEDAHYNLWGVYMLLIVPVFCYHLICELAMNGQSVGKKLLGIRVVSETGSRPGASQFIIRWLIRTGDYTILIILVLNIFLLFNKELLIFLAASVILLLADIVLVVSSKKGQRLGDMLAHTILVRTVTRGSVEQTVFMDVEDSYRPSYPEIMRLSDRDINAIKNILDASRKKNDVRLADMAAARIKSHLKIQSELPPVDFLSVLLKDYNYLSTK
ncbi:MAG TPA: RDD family protein [Chitinophagaceae bacterium]